MMDSETFNKKTRITVAFFRFKWDLIEVKVMDRPDNYISDCLDRVTIFEINFIMSEIRTVKKLILLNLLCLLLTTGCNKEEPVKYNIIEPGSYLPVYPDSFWKYLVNDSTIVFDSTGDTYTLQQHPFIYDDYNYVPLYYAAPGSPLGINGPIYRYDRLEFTPKRGPGTILWPILSEEVGSSFWVHSPAIAIPYFYNERATVEAKIFDGRDSILIISGIYHRIDGYDTTTFRRHREYTKNTGISKEIVIDSLTQDTVSKIVLIDHYINH